MPTVTSGDGRAEDGALCGCSTWQGMLQHVWGPPSNSKCRALLYSHVGSSSVASPPGLLSPLHITLAAAKLPLLTPPGNTVLWAPLLGTRHATLVSFIAKLREFMSL